MKYSVIVPCYNGLKYIPSCIESILSQTYDNFELIVSDDHSTDGTSEYLRGLDHDNLKLLTAPHRMSMTEHWEWALSHARGEWCIFVGQDDGLQSYFFELADILTSYANKKNCRTIMSERAYYFWPGCEDVYGDVHVSYTGSPFVKCKGTAWSAIQALTGISSYFDLPQMYTTSLFRKSILDEARVKQRGKVFSTHPQDANLAAIACSLDHFYIRSYVPLGWVGTSPKSAGMAISSSSVDLANLRNAYLQKISSSSLAYCSQIGSFSLDSAALYFWGALLQTKALRSPLSNRLLQLKLIKYGIFCAAYNATHACKKGTRGEVARVARENGCSVKVLMMLVPLHMLFVKCIHLVQTFIKKLKKMKLSSVNLYLEQDNFIFMEQASSQVFARIDKKSFLKTMRHFTKV